MQMVVGVLIILNYITIRRLRTCLQTREFGLQRKELFFHLRNMFFNDNSFIPWPVYVIFILLQSEKKPRTKQIYECQGAHVGVEYNMRDGM